MQPDKKGMLYILSLLLILCLAACDNNSTPPQQGPGAPTKASMDKQVLLQPYTDISDLSTLDPALVQDANANQAVNMLYNGLVQIGDQGTIINALAASYKVAPDGLTWTFTLRNKLTFSDGTPLTSADVAYSLDRALRIGSKTAYASYALGLIRNANLLAAGQVKTLIGSSIQAPDPQTVNIVTSKKAAYFPSMLTYPAAYVVEKSMVTRYGNNFINHLSEGGGSGPWIVSRYIHNQEIDFTPNPNYFGAKPQLRLVARPFYKVDETAYRAYESGTLSYAPVPEDQIQQAKALSNNQFHQDPTLVTAYYTMNYLVKPFDNIKVRQAFSLALNKDQITTNAYNGSVIATNHIVPQGISAYNAKLSAPGGITGTTGNPTLAKKLFDEGLQEDGLTLSTLPPITLTVSTGGLPDAQKEITLETQMWQNTLGITVKVNDEDYTKLLTDSQATTGNKKGLMFWGLGWIGYYPDAQDWLSVQFGQGAPNNNMNYGQNSSADASQQQTTQQLLAQADSNLNATQRLQQYMQAEQQLVNDVTWLPIYQQTLTYVQKPCVVGITSNAFAITPPNDWSKVYISTDTPCADTGKYK
ncbi:MAG: peptide ABC transporter substrate-binding protein [Ktedonobacteraceae bacterium]|nr:peptide ABC transporter substrate-binding protein [Ktedonobacteraceae bacterium]